MGVVECRQHGLVEPFNVLWEKEGQFCMVLNFKLAHYCSQKGILGLN